MLYLLYLDHRDQHLRWFACHLHSLDTIILCLPSKVWDYVSAFHIYRGVSWCDDSLALVYESWYKTRKIRTWVVSPGSEDVAPRILFDRSSEDVYSDPGSPMMRRTQAGTYIIARIKKESDEGRYIILNGNGATPEGNIPFLDLFDM